MNALLARLVPGDIAGLGSEKEAVVAQLVAVDQLPVHGVAVVAVPPVDILAGVDRGEDVEVGVLQQGQANDLVMLVDAAAFQLGNVYLRYTAPHDTPFFLSPGGPPDVTQTPGGATGYPGVKVTADRNGKVSPQTVVVSLPQDRGLQFVEEGQPGYQLTVLDSHGAQKNHLGDLSADGQTLTFKNVRLGLSGKASTSTVWVAVKASNKATPGHTSVTFRVGHRTGHSTTINVC